MKNQHIRLRILIPLTVAIAVLLGAFVLAIQRAQNTELERDVQHTMRAAKMLLSTEFEEEDDLMRGILEVIVSKDRFRDAFLARDRGQLLAHTQDIFDRLHEQCNITHLYFSTPDRVCFLRVHQPDRHGDVIDRHSTLKAEETGDTASGLELGPLGTLTHRVVRPWYDNGRLIGYVELGEELGHITSELEDVLEVKLPVLLHKKFLDREGWEAGSHMLGYDADWSALPHHVFVKQPDEIVRTALAQHGEPDTHHSDGDCCRADVGKHRYQLAFMPLQDARGREVGDVAILLDVTEPLASNRLAILWVTLASLAVGGALFAGFYIHLGRVEKRISRYMAERAKNQETREHIARCHARLNVLQRELLGAGPLDEKLRKITDAVVDVFDADFCRIWLTWQGDLCESGCVHAAVTEGPHVCRYRDRCLHLKASSGRYTHIDGKTHRRVPFGCYKIGRVASDEKPKFLTNDVTHDPRVHDHEWASELGLVSFAGYQLRPPGGETSGVLALFAAHPISPEDDALLEMLGHTTAQVIRQARAEAALQRFRQALDNAADAILLIDRDRMLFVDVNDTACESLGYTREELLSMGPQDIKPNFTRETLAMVFDSVIRNRSCGTIETVYQRKDGGTFPVEVSLTSLPGERERLLVASVRDTTQRKKAEEAFRDSEERYSRLVNNLSVGVAQIGPDMKIMSMNRQIRRWFPNARLHEHPSCHAALDCPGDQPCPDCPVRRTLRDGEPHELVVEKPGPDGKRHFRAIATPIRDAEGNVTSAIELLEDVTGLKNAEARLKQTMTDLERFNRLAVGRELRMIELKREVNEMARRAGLPLPYDVQLTEFAQEVPPNA